MKELVVLSGKGGTGKTTFLASLTPLLPGSKVFADADVEAANLALLLKAEEEKRTTFLAGYLPKRDEDLCSACGICREKCRFGAIDEDLAFDPFLCEGCGVCAWFCPEGAISLEEKKIGFLISSATPYGPLIHAELFPGEENSGKLVAAVKRKATALAKGNQALLLVDGAPGVGCPVIASLSGADAVLVVSEPTVAGLHDLGRLVALLYHFKIPGFVVVNKADLNPELTEKILAYPGLTPLGEIPFDEEVVDTLRQGEILTEVSDGPAAKAIKEIARRIQKEILEVSHEDSRTP